MSYIGEDIHYDYSNEKKNGVLHLKRREIIISQFHSINFICPLINRGHFQRGNAALFLFPPEHTLGWRLFWTHHLSAVTLSNNQKYLKHALQNWLSSLISTCFKEFYYILSLLYCILSLNYWSMNDSQILW